MLIAPATAPTRPAPSVYAAAAQPLGRPPVPADPREVLRVVLGATLDAAQGAYLSTLSNAKYDATQPFWISRASKLLISAQASMLAAVEIRRIVPDVPFIPLLVLRPFEDAANSIAAAAEMPLGSAERKASVDHANFKIKLAVHQLGLMIEDATRS